MFIECARHDVPMSPLSSFGLNEFDFTTHLSSKRENFFGRSWFFRELGDIFENINDNTKGVLVTGDPGSGKSALISQLVCSPFSNFLIYDNIVGYHICDYSEVLTRDGSSFVHNLVNQIAISIPEYATRVLGKKQIQTQLEKRCERDPTACFLTTIIGPLRELKTKPTNFKYIVIDALDECIEKDRETSAILNILCYKLSYFPQWLKIIASSRNWTAVTSKVPQTVKRMPLNSDDERNIEDIRSYISRYLRTKSSFLNKLWNTIPETTDELTKHADGNFLFVKTVLMNNLGPDDTINVHSLPNSLNDMYGQIFQRYFIKEDSVRFEILFEILLAAGSLHEADISEIFERQNQDKNIQTLLAHVSSLLHFGHDGTVNIYHKSFSEWLLSNGDRMNGFSFQKRRGHAYIADLLVDRTKINITMTFKQLSQLCMHVLNSGGPSDEHRKQLALLNVSKIYNQQNGKCILHELAQTQNGSRLLEIFRPSFFSVDVPDVNGKSPAFYAALGGFVDNLQLLINYGTCANCILKNVSSSQEIKAAMKMKRYEESTTMHAATYNGHTNVINALLKHNASFNEFNEYVPTLLHMAAERGHLDIVKLLLENGDKADVISLHHAAAKNHSHVVEYLLKAVGVKDGCLKCEKTVAKFSKVGRNKTYREIHNIFCETALHAAVSKHYTHIVKLLLQFGKSALECKHHSGKTPLMDAVERNDTEMAELLLKNGANVEEKCGVEMLLNAGKTSGVQFFYGRRSLYTVYREKTSCPCGNKALHLCAKYGLSHMAEHLINNWNASVLDKNCNGESVWKIANASYNEDFIYHVTQVLLNMDDETALNRKSWNMGIKNLRAFKNLLRKFSKKTKPYQSSFQCDSTFEGMSPLHIAALMGVDMLNRVHKKAHKSAPNLPLNCTNRHWITPRYLAYFYDSIPTLTDQSINKKQTPRSNNEYTKTMLQYPDREAEFHMIFNYFYDTLDDWKYFDIYEMFKPLEKYGITNCPGYYDMPTKQALEPSCDRFSSTSESTSEFTQDIPPVPTKICRHEIQICIPMFEERVVSTELEEVIFNEQEFTSTVEKILAEMMEWEEYMIDCGCPTIMRLLHDMYTKLPKENRYINQFILERMGWKETSSDGEILKHWPLYFFHKKLRNEYQSYKYLDILKEGFKMKTRINANDEN